MNPVNGISIEDVKIRPLSDGEAVPYALLLDADPSRELVDAYLPQSEVYVAVMDNRQVGVYLLYPESCETVEIKNIAVDDEYQGRGIGKLMLADAIERAKVSRYKTIVIGTGNSSIGQLYLYQKMGFEILSIRKNFFIDNYSEVLYENEIQVKHMIMLARQLK